MSYSLDPKREMLYMVIDRTDEIGMEGVYAGSYNDCQAFLYEQSQYCSIGMEIILNPHYNTKGNK